jgi:hypothetical protein
MTIINSIQQVREESAKLQKEVNGTVAFIVLVRYSPRKAFYGVNYLSPIVNIGSTYSGLTTGTTCTVIDYL